MSPLLFPEDDADEPPTHYSAFVDLRDALTDLAVGIEQNLGSLVSRPLTALSRVFYRD